MIIDVRPSFPEMFKEFHADVNYRMLTCRTASLSSSDSLFIAAFSEDFLDIVIVFFLGFLHFLVSLTYIFRCDTIILIKIFRKKKNPESYLIYMYIPSKD